MLSPPAHQALFSLPAFRCLPEDDRKQVASLVQEVVLAKGRVVYTKGDEADAMYLVATGAVDALDGDSTIVRYGPGDVFGESVLLAGEHRAVTTCVALDALLVVLPRLSLELLIGLHPELHEHLSVVLMRRLKDAMHVILGIAKPRPSEIVALQGWRSEPDRRAFIGALADALERELGQDVAILTVASDDRSSAAPARRDRPDSVVVGTAADGGVIRERIAAELARRAAQAPIVLTAVDDGLAAVEPDLAHLANTVLSRIDGRLPIDRVNGHPHVVFVHDRRNGTGPSLCGNRVVSLPVEEDRRGRAFARLARTLTHRSVGLALGSGAAWGFAHIGVLDVFEREHIPIDVVTGASMGAIVGAHYALGFSPARLEEIATSVRDIPGLMRILPRLLYLASDFNVTRPGLFAGEHFQRVLESLGPMRDDTFADLEIPFRAIATDISTGARVELVDGNLSDAMRASFSAPWIFSPFRIGDHVLIDGGMSDPVPAETARSMGAAFVIGVNVVPPVYPRAQNPFEAVLRLLEKINPMAITGSTRLPNSFDVVVRTLQIMQHELGNVRAGEADLLINPELQDYWVLEFWRAAEIIEQGRRAAEAELPAIRAKLDALHGNGAT